MSWSHGFRTPSGGNSHKNHDKAIEMAVEPQIYSTSVAMTSPSEDFSYGDNTHDTDTKHGAAQDVNFSRVGVEEESYYAISPHISLDYADVFREPKEYVQTRIGDILTPGIQKVFGVIFMYSQMLLYYTLTLVTGVFLGLTWGFIFGVLNYLIVWIIQPITKIFFICIRLVALPIRALTRAFCDPAFQSVGQMLSYLLGRIRIHVSGMQGTFTQRPVMHL